MGTTKDTKEYNSNQTKPKPNPNETMMFLSRTTILTAVLLVTTAVVETQAQSCTDVSDGCAGVGTTCTYQQSCTAVTTAGTCLYNCDQLGSYLPGKIPSPSKANN